MKDSAEGTIATSTAALDLPEAEIADLERYIDATRGEMLFARGVVLVEGMAEAILLPALARSLDMSLDQLGITVCAINGTHFTSYVRFLNALSIPWAVVTDMDPETKSPGDRRIARIQHQLETGRVLPKDADVAVWAAKAKAAGMFVGTYTFEVDLFKAGLADTMREVFQELNDGVIAERAATWDPDHLDEEQVKDFLDDIETISKGRFAQRLSQKLPPHCCPDYIREALEHVSSRVRKELSTTIPGTAGGVEGKSPAV